MADLRPRDPKADLIIIGGISIEAGLGSDTYLEIEYNSPPYGDPYVGVDGEAAIVKSNDSSARIRVTLQQTSPHNTTLSALLNADRLAPNGLGGFPIFIKQNEQIFEGEKAVIINRPTYSNANTIQERVWEFWCADLREVTTIV